MKTKKEYSLVELIEILTGFIGDVEIGFIKEIEKAGLTARQLNYLDAIERFNNPTVSEMARGLNLSKPSISIIIDKFSSLGYVKRMHSLDDRRSFRIHLTEKARRMIKMHDKVHRRIADIFRRNLNKEELDLLLRLLNKVVKKMIPTGADSAIDDAT